MVTFRARDPYTALALRYTDVLTASRTGEMSECPAVCEPPLTHSEKSADLLGLPQIKLIFRCPLCVVPRKHAEVAVEKQNPDDSLKYRVSEDKGNNNENKQQACQKSS